MIRIAITEAAFEAIADTLPFGSVGYGIALNEWGERLVWLEARWSTSSPRSARARRELRRRHLGAGRDREV